MKDQDHTGAICATAEPVDSRSEAFSAEAGPSYPSSRSRNIRSLCTLCSVPDSAETIHPDNIGVDPDWSGILATANDHGVAPLICKRVETFTSESMPEIWREHYHEEFTRNCCRNLFLASELLEALAALDKIGVSATPFKGPVLAVQAYGDLSARQFADLDILIPQRHVLRANGALLAAGFQPEMPGSVTVESDRQIPGQYAYENANRTRIELHTERTLRYFPRPLNFDALCHRRKSIAIAGHSIPSFSPEDTLILLSVHGSKHFWERLIWIADIAALATNTRLDWVAALDRARDCGTERMVLLGAGLAHDALGLSLPSEVANPMAQDSTVRRLIGQVRARLFAEHSMELGLFSRFAFRSRMRGDGITGLRYAIRFAVQPTEWDRSDSRFAGRLEPLNALVRPFRLARDYGWRSRVKR